MILEEQPAKVAEAVKLFLQGLGKTKQILCVDHDIIEVLKFASKLEIGLIVYLLFCFLPCQKK